MTLHTLTKLSMKQRQQIQSYHKSIVVDTKKKEKSQKQLRQIRTYFYKLL